MIYQHFPINNRPYSLATQMNQEFQLNANKNYLFDLSYLSMIEIQGDKAQEFLQGQITCNLLEIDSQNFRQGALCNLKGRVLALLDVLKDDHLKLILPSDLVADTLTNLGKTAPFFNVNLRPVHTHQALGLYLQNNDDLKPLELQLSPQRLSLSKHNNSYCYHLGHNLYVLLVSTNDADSIKLKYEDKAQLKGSLLWHSLKLKHLQAEIYPHTRGLFLPHRLDLHLSGHISFDKGCYKGQEIIARTHYRAKIKHELKLFTIETTEAVVSGEKLMTEDSRIEIGEIIDFSPIGDSSQLILVSILIDHPSTCLIGNQKKIIQLNAI